MKVVLLDEGWRMCVVCVCEGQEVVCVGIVYSHQLVPHLTQAHKTSKLVVLEHTVGANQWFVLDTVTQYLVSTNIYQQWSLDYFVSL